MAGFMLSRARAILAALTLVCLIGVPPAAAETVLRIANLAEPESLDPHKVLLNPQVHVVRNLFEGLVVLDPKGNVVPGAAESWSVSEDNLFYRFKLRANGKWSNGDPVTAADFVFALRRVEDPKTNAEQPEELYAIKNAEEVNAGKLAPAALGVAAPDERTVEITLKAPTAVARIARHAADAQRPADQGRPQSDRAEMAARNWSRRCARRSARAHTARA